LGGDNELARIVADFCGGARRIFSAILQHENYSGSISKVKQGGCTRKGYAVRFPMLRIERYAKRTTQTVLMHGQE
jgi:hypothetical protein